MFEFNHERNLICPKMMNVIALTALILSFQMPALWAMAKRPEASDTPTQVRKLTLQDCYELALKRSETVALRKEEIEIAEAQIFKATSEALGDVDFVITDQTQEVPKTSGTDSSGISSTFNARERRERYFQINQPIFQGFKSIGALTGAGGLTAQRKEEWIRAKHLLYLDVVNAFHNLLLLEKDVKDIEEINKLFGDRVKDLTDRSKIGRSREGEVATAIARMKIHEADLEKSKGARNIARFTLEFLTGESLDGVEFVDDELPQQAPDKVDDYLENAEYRPDVRASGNALKIAKRGILVAQSGFWPVISVEHTQYEKKDGFQSGMDWDFLFKIDIPLFRGGENVGKFKESVSQYKIAKKNKELTERKAELEIKQTYQEWLTSLKESSALSEAVKAVEKNYDLQKEDYSRSLVNNLDVLEALESWLSTSRDANRSFYNMKSNYWRFQVAIGNCCEEAAS